MQRIFGSNAISHVLHTYMQFFLAILFISSRMEWWAPARPAPFFSRPHAVYFESFIHIAPWFLCSFPCSTIPIVKSKQWQIQCTSTQNKYWALKWNWRKLDTRELQKCIRNHIRHRSLTATRIKTDPAHPNCEVCKSNQYQMCACDFV